MKVNFLMPPHRKCTKMDRWRTMFSKVRVKGPGQAKSDQNI